MVTLVTLSGTRRIANLRFTLFWLQLIDDILWVLMRNSDKFCMTASGNDLIILVDEFNRCKSQSFTNCEGFPSVHGLDEAYR